MKTKLTILNFEDKIAKNKARFTRFETGRGWMSCWDKGLCETLKDLVDKDVVVEIIQKGDFQNIMGICPDGEQEEDDDFYVDEGHKNFAKKETLTAKDAVKPEYKPKSYNETQGTSFYTAYAKDIFIAQYEKGCNVDLIMLECIQLVKKAKEAFS